MSSRINTTSSEVVCAKWTLLARTGGRLAHLLPALMLALVPKCPVCLATYASALGAGALLTSDIGSAVRTIACFALAISIGFVWWGAVRQPPLWPAVGASISALGLLLVRDNVPAWLRVPVAMAVGLFVLAHFKRMRLANKPKGNGNG